MSDLDRKKARHAAHYSMGTDKLIALSDPAAAQGREIPWTEARDQELRDLKAQSLSNRAIAARLGRSTNSVGGRWYKLMKGVPGRPKRPKWTLGEIAQLKDLTHQGMTDAQIAERLKGRDRLAVTKKRLATLGDKGGRPGDYATALPKVTADRVAALWVQGVAIKVIARRLDLTTAQVQGARTKAGLPARPSKHGQATKATRIHLTIAPDLYAAAQTRAAGLGLTLSRWTERLIEANLLSEK